MKPCSFFCSLFFLCCLVGAQGQDMALVTIPNGEISSGTGIVPQPATLPRLIEQKDMSDMMRRIFKPRFAATQSTLTKEKKKFLTLIPAVGFTPETGLAVLVAGNLAFYTAKNDNTNLSTLTSSLAYTRNQQIILPVRTNIWTKNNAFNFIGDYRFLKYPQNNYGLGGNISQASLTTLDYYYFRFYQTALKKVSKSFYTGLGYHLDYHWAIKETTIENAALTDFRQYQNGKSTTVSSGVSLNLLYDNRVNSINPLNGFYANAIYRHHATALGSSTSYQTLSLDVRKYFKTSPHSDNVLAIWGFSWLTLAGNAPYLDMPATGWDPTNNSGRGYIQSRFRGNHLLYLESEYRFGISRNGLLGGVVFANAQSVAEKNNQFMNIMPAAGTGLRLKLNKHSSTNLAIDYAMGMNGSSGLYFNIGEAF